MKSIFFIFVCIWGLFGCTSASNNIPNRITEVVKQTNAELAKHQNVINVAQKMFDKLEPVNQYANQEEIASLNQLAHIIKSTVYQLEAIYHISPELEFYTDFYKIIIGVRDKKLTYYQASEYISVIQARYHKAYDIINQAHRERIAAENAIFQRKLERNNERFNRAMQNNRSQKTSRTRCYNLGSDVICDTTSY
ncbi:hypothetical protein [Volucribacter amazonae]|uniref:Lipoprotein n=1 Tax=Volucribacter amazonae TaxID=256731 RepID=A0A9X4PN70_9PAST|nr:hypothetical protein [Volucribacter amazonae]MDG6894833.1 hypothetical protein [Volucribacter amazonae]